MSRYRPYALLAWRNLDQFCDLLLAQRRRNEFQVDRFRNQRLEAMDLVGIDQAFGKNSSRTRLAIGSGHAGKFGVVLDDLRIYEYM